MHDKSVRHERAINAAVAEFHRALARSYPEAKTGDLEPQVAWTFECAARRVVLKWIEANVPPHPAIGTAVAVSIDGEPALGVVVHAEPHGNGDWWTVQLRESAGHCRTLRAHDCIVLDDERLDSLRTAGSAARGER